MSTLIPVFNETFYHQVEEHYCPPLSLRQHVRKTFLFNPDPVFEPASKQASQLPCCLALQLPWHPVTATSYTLLSFYG